MTIGKAGEASGINPMPSPKPTRTGKRLPQNIQGVTKPTAPPSSIPGPSSKANRRALATPASLSQVDLNTSYAASAQFCQIVKDLNHKPTEAQLEKALKNLNELINHITVKGSYIEPLHREPLLNSLQELDKKLATIAKTKNKEVVFNRLIQKSGDQLKASIEIASGRPLLSASLKGDMEKLRKEKTGNNELEGIIKICKAYTVNNNFWSVDNMVAPLGIILTANIGLLQLEKGMNDLSDAEIGIVMDRLNSGKFEELAKESLSGKIPLGAILRECDFLLQMNELSSDKTGEQAIEQATGRLVDALQAKGLLKNFPFLSYPGLSARMVVNSNLDTTQKAAIEKALSKYRNIEANNNNK